MEHYLISSSIINVFKDHFRFDQKYMSFIQLFIIKFLNIDTEILFLLIFCILTCWVGFKYIKLPTKYNVFYIHKDFLIKFFFYYFEKKLDIKLSCDTLDVYPLVFNSTLSFLPNLNEWVSFNYKGYFYRAKIEAFTYHKTKIINEKDFSNKVEIPVKEVKLRIESDNPKIKNFVDELNQEYNKRDSIEIVVVSDNEQIQNYHVLKNELIKNPEDTFIKSLFNPEFQKIYKVCKFMLDSSYNYFSHTSMSPNLGFLLYGPPGTGKTSFINRLALSLNLNITIVNLSDPEMTISKFNKMLNKKSIFCFDEFYKTCLTLIENEKEKDNTSQIDFQSLDGKKIEAISKYQEKQTQKLTFEDLFSLFQGPATGICQIFIATMNSYSELVNHPTHGKRISQFFRTGRMKPTYIGNMKKINFEMLIEYHFPELKFDIPDVLNEIEIRPSDVINFVAEMKILHPPEMWQELFQNYINSLI